MRFLEPDNTLVELLETYLDSVSSDAIYVDCGAGEGALELAFGSERMYSIDLRPAAEHVQYGEAMTFPWGDRFVPLFCRPCHSVTDWAKRTFDAAESAGSPGALYISKPENLDVDLFGWPVKVLGKWIGAEGERVYAPEWPPQRKEPIRWREGYLYTWARVKVSGEEDWKAVVGNRYTNFPGGCRVGDVSHAWDVIRSERAEDAEDLDWTGTHLDQPNSDSGWLSPGGVWYGCGSTNHDPVAYLVIKKEVHELEDAGWIRVYDSEKWIRIRGFPTAEQRNWLLLRGHKVD